MKFLVDAQLPVRLARFIQASGHDTLREQREKVGFSVGDRPSHLKAIDWLRVSN